MNDNIELRNSANTELTYARAIINTILNSAILDNEDIKNTLEAALKLIERANNNIAQINIEVPNA
ncbi:hypothetical protein V6N22_000808 [Providencia stuartii]|uniref:hypothetical protein n=1 Tax=Providencia stuartii TaxID=588 RepID=UPI00090A0B87|nr:hypothetical protein [Providencia stuartii]APG53098.1 hypothetical protein BGK56_20030 [Providencia stuartii]MBG5903778.1 hypothetical protein [Providencia stuartii]MBG5934655.1 hypothetical protein [Providencia stuartii]WAZ73658.1 hypothetical protein O4Z98_13605 [Providencia stuartii]WAZ79989.1 hypothetical protein O4001_07305 [Providencia stuartii]